MHDHHDDEEEDPCGPPGEVPEGAAVFPLIPKELGIHPLLLAVLHAVVFFDGSSEDVVNDAAANEAAQLPRHVLAAARGRGAETHPRRHGVPGRLRKQEKWPQEELQFLKDFLDDFGVK